MRLLQLLRLSLVSIIAMSTTSAAGNFRHQDALDRIQAMINREWELATSVHSLSAVEWDREQSWFQREFVSVVFRDRFRDGVDSKLRRYTGMRICTPSVTTSACGRCMRTSKSASGLCRSGWVECTRTSYRCTGRILRRYLSEMWMRRERRERSFGCTGGPPAGRAHGT